MNNLAKAILIAVPVVILGVATFIFKPLIILWLLAFIFVGLVLALNGVFKQMEDNKNNRKPR